MTEKPDQNASHNIPDCESSLIFKITERIILGFLLVGFLIIGGNLRNQQSLMLNPWFTSHHGIGFLNTGSILTILAAGIMIIAGTEISTLKIPLICVGTCLIISMNMGLIAYLNEFGQIPFWTSLLNTAIVSVMSYLGFFLILRQTILRRKQTSHKR